MGRVRVRSGKASICRRLRQRARELLARVAGLAAQALAHRQRVAVHAPVVDHAEGEHAGDVVAGFLVADRLDPEVRIHARALRLPRSEEHTSELQSLMRISYAVLCLTKKKSTQQNN